MSLYALEGLDGLCNETKEALVKLNAVEGEVLHSLEGDDILQLNGRTGLLRRDPPNEAKMLEVGQLCSQLLRLLLPDGNRIKG